MGLFYFNKSDAEVKAEEKQKSIEAKEIAQETLELVSDAPNEIFPEFLWKPQINEFEFEYDYKTKAACTNPAVIRAYSIGRKYPNYWEYLEAMDAYVEYAKYIENVFGSFEMMKRANRDGYSSVFIPNMPKLTHKKKNKLLIETGFMPSRVDEDYEVPDEVIEESLKALPEHELSFDEDEKVPKRISRIWDAMSLNKAKSDRVAGIFAYSSGYGYTRRQGVDAIIASLSSPTTDDTINKSGYESLSEEIDELHEFDGIPPEIIEAMFTQVKYVVNGYITNDREAQTVEIIRTLEMNGFDFLNSSATKNMNTSAVRALNRQFARDTDLSSLSKKERKKYKKKMRKIQEDQKRSILGDQKIRKTLLNNRIHLSRSEGDALGVDSSIANFHLCDVFPGGDN